MHKCVFFSNFQVCSVCMPVAIYSCVFVSIHYFQSDKAQGVEVEKMLRTILEFEQKDTRRDSALVALVAHCLAMLWFMGGDSLQVR